MAKQLHTHRGHCQLCASVQAIDTKTGLIAQHGYTRAGGYFSGSCPGSSVLNLHVSRTRADERIAAARKEMVESRNLATRFECGLDFPLIAWNGEYKMVRAFGRDIVRFTSQQAPYSKLEKDEVLVSWELAPVKFQAISLARAIVSLRNRADNCESYANDLERWANRITGKVNPYQVSDLEPRDWEVGDTVHIGGKKGYDAVVEAVEMRPYVTFGSRRGRSTVDVKHVRITQPEVTEKRVSEKAGGYVTREARPARTLWVAMRDIKDRKSNPLVDELKMAGVL